MRLSFFEKLDTLLPSYRILTSLQIYCFSTRKIILRKEEGKDWEEGEKKFSGYRFHLK
ncbi:hypothetical protein GCM10020331_078010 [Ectobacillus funiculus]